MRNRTISNLERLFQACKPEMIMQQIEVIQCKQNPQHKGTSHGHQNKQRCLLHAVVLNVGAEEDILVIPSCDSHGCYWTVETFRWFWCQCWAQLERSVVKGQGRILAGCDDMICSRTAQMESLMSCWRKSVGNTKWSIKISCIDMYDCINKSTRL